MPKNKKIKVKDLAHLTSENPNPVIRMSEKGKIIYSNLPGKKLLKRMRKKINKEDLACFNAIAKKALMQNEIKRVEINADKSTFFFIILPVIAEQQINMYGFNVSGRVKLQKRMKKERIIALKAADDSADKLVDAQEELKKAKRLADMGTLAATVAHELRNPLGVMQTALFNIKRKRSNTDIDKHLSNIDKKIAESTQIINNLLNYSRIKPPVFEMVNLYDVINETIDSIKKRFYNSGVSVRIKIARLKNFIIEADAYQIHEVLINIITNAFQATQDNKGTITVKGYIDDNEHAVIECSDTGYGIDKEDMERIFEPFFTRKSKGTGLGLCICAEIINLHNGHIVIKSRKGKGTKLRIWIPIKRR